MPQPSAIDEYLRQNGLSSTVHEIGGSEEDSGPSAIDVYLAQNGLSSTVHEIGGAAPEQVEEPADDTGALGQIYGETVRGFTGMVASLPEAMGLVAYNWQRKYFGGIEGQTPEEWSGLMKIGGALRGAGEFITPTPSEQYKDSLWITEVPRGIGTVLGFAVGGKGLGTGLKAAASRTVTTAAVATAKVEAKLIARGMTPALAKKMAEKSAAKATAQQAAGKSARGWYSEEVAARAARYDTAGVGTIGGAVQAVEGWNDAVATLLAKAKAEGRDELTDAEYEQAWESFIFNIPAGVSEIAGANRIALKLFKNLDKGSKGVWSAGWRRIVKDAAGGAVEEAAQESFQTAWMNYGAAEVAKYDENRKLFEGVIHAGGVGGIIGGMFGGLLAGINRKANLYKRIQELRTTKGRLEATGSTEAAAQVQKEIDKGMEKLGAGPEERARLVAELRAEAEAEFAERVEGMVEPTDKVREDLRAAAKEEILESFVGVDEGIGIVTRTFPDTGLYATTTEEMTKEEAAEVTEREIEEVDVEVEDVVLAKEIKRQEAQKAKLQKRLDEGDLTANKAQDLVNQIGKLEASLETLKAAPKTLTEKQKRPKARRSVAWVLRDKDGNVIKGKDAEGKALTELTTEQLEEAVIDWTDAETIADKITGEEAERVRKEAEAVEKKAAVGVGVDEQLAEIEKQVEAEEAEAKQRAELAGLDSDQMADLTGKTEPQIVADVREADKVDPIVYEVLDDDVEVDETVLAEADDAMLEKAGRVYKVKQLGEVKKAQAAVNKAEGILKRDLSEDARKAARKRLREAKARLKEANENQTRFVDAAFMRDVATAKAEAGERAEGKKKFEEEEAERIRKEDEAAAEPFTRRATEEAIELARKLGYLSTAEELEAKGLIESLEGQVPTAGGVAVDPDTGAQLYWNIDISPIDGRRKTINEGDVVNRMWQRLLLDKEYAQEEAFQKWFKDTFAGEQDTLSLLIELNSEAAIEQRGGVVLNVDTIMRLRAEKNEEIKAEQKATKEMTEAARARSVRVAIHKARLEHEAKEKRREGELELRKAIGADPNIPEEIKSIAFGEPSTSRVEADFTEAEEAQLVQSMLLGTTRADAPITMQEMRVMHTALVNKEAAKEQEAEPATKPDKGILKRLKAEVKKVFALLKRKDKEIEKSQEKVDATESNVASEAGKLEREKEQLLEGKGKWKQLRKWYTWAANRAKQIETLEGMLETHGAGVEGIFANELEAELRQKVLSILRLDKNADISVTENGIRIALDKLRADKARVEAYIAEIEVDALGELQAKLDAAKKKGIPAEQKLKELEAEMEELKEAAANYKAAIEGEMGEVKVRIGRREMATATLWEGVTRGIRYRIYKLDQDTAVDMGMRKAVTELADLQKEFAGRRRLTPTQKENYQDRIASIESAIAAYVEEGAGTFFVNTASTYSETMSLKQFEAETTGQNAGGYIILSSGKNSTGTIDAPVTRDEAMRWMEGEGEGKGKGPFTVTFTTPHSFATLEAVKDFMGVTVREGAVSYEAGGVEYFSRLVKPSHWGTAGQVSKDAAARHIERINELKEQLAGLEAVQKSKGEEVSVEGLKSNTPKAKKIKEYVKAFKEAVIGELAGKVITRDGKEEAFPSTYEGVVVDKIIATLPTGKDAKLLRIGDGVFVKLTEPTTIYINPNILMKHFTVTNGELIPIGGKTNRTMTSVVREELSHLLDLQTIYSLLESRNLEDRAGGVKRYLAKIGNSLTAKQRELLEGVYTGHKHTGRNKNTGKLTPSQLGMEALRMLREKPDILMFETEDAARSRPVYQNIWKQLRGWVENKFGATDERIDKEGNRVPLPEAILRHIRAANSYLSIQRDAQGRELYAEAHTPAGGQAFLYLRIPTKRHKAGPATIYTYKNTKEGWEAATAKLNEEWEKLPKETKKKHKKDELIQTAEGVALKNIDQAAVLRPQSDLSLEQDTYIVLNELRGIPLSDADVKALEKVLTSLENDRAGRSIAAEQEGRKPVKVTLEEKDKNWATYVSVMARREARTVWGEIDGGADAQASYGQFRTTVLDWLKREQEDKGATKEEAEEDARTKELPRGIAETDAIAYYTNLFAKRTAKAFRSNYVVSVSYKYTAGKDSAQVAKVERLKIELKELEGTPMEGESEEQRTRRIATLKKEIKAAGTVSWTKKFPDTEQGKRDAVAAAFSWLKRQAAIDRGKSTKEEQEEYVLEMPTKATRLSNTLESQANNGVELKEGIKVGEGVGGKTGILVVGSLDPKHKGAATLLREHSQEFQKHYYAKKRGNMAQYLKLVDHRRLLVQPTYQELLDEQAQSIANEEREVTHRDLLIASLNRYDESIEIIEEKKTYDYSSAVFQTEEEAKKFIETEEWQVNPTVTPVEVVVSGSGHELKWAYRQPILNEKGEVSGAEVVVIEEDALELLPVEKGSKIRGWPQNKVRFAMVDGQKTRVTRESFETEATTRTEYKLIGGRIQNRLDEDHLLTEAERLVLETFLNESGDMALMPTEAGKALDAIANNPDSPLHKEVLALYKSGAIENDYYFKDGVLVREAIIEETQDYIIFEVTEEDKAGIRNKHGEDSKGAEKEIKEAEIAARAKMRSIAQYDVHEGKPVPLEEGQIATMNYHAINKQIALREGNLLLTLLNSAVMKLRVATDTADGLDEFSEETYAASLEEGMDVDGETIRNGGVVDNQRVLGVQVGSFFSSATDSLRKMEVPVLDDLANKIDAYYNRETELYGQFFTGLKVIERGGVELVGTDGDGNERGRGINAYFNTKEEALAHAKANGWNVSYTVTVEGYGRSAVEMAEMEAEAYFSIRERLGKNKQDYNQRVAEYYLNSKMSEAGKALVAWHKGVGVDTATLLKKSDVKVKLPEGRSDKEEWRKIKTLGATHFPRMFSQQAWEIIKNHSRHPEAYRNMQKLMVENESASDMDHAHAKLQSYADTINQTETQTIHDFFANMEKARTFKLPDEFYDTSMAAYKTYMRKFTSRMAQIEVFGQPHNKETPDPWQLAKDAVSGKNREYIADLHRSVYRVRQGRDQTIEWLTKIGLPAAGVLYLSGPLTAIRNTTFALRANAESFGVPQTFLTATKTLYSIAKGEYQNAESDYAHAQALGLLRNDWVEARQYALSDDEITFGFEHKYREKMSKLQHYALYMQRATENFNRTVTAAMALQHLRVTREAFETDPHGKTAAQGIAMIQRMGYSPEQVKLLFSKDKDGNWDADKATKDRFVRDMVFEKQYGYNIRQHPLWMDGPSNRILFQFQKWGYQRTRDFGKNVLMPAVVGTKVTMPDGTVKTVRDGRMLYRNLFLFIGQGQLYATLMMALFYDKERDEMVIPVSEKSGDWMLGLGEMLRKDLIYDGGLGIVTDWASWTHDQVDKRASRWKQPVPLNPPAYTLVKDSLDVIRNISNVLRNDTGKGAKKEAVLSVLENAARKLPLIRAGYGLRFTALRAAEIDTYDLAVQDGKKDVRIIRAAGRKFADLNGYDDARVWSGGKIAQTEKRELYTQLYEALLVGDVRNARALRDRLIGDATGKERKSILSGMKASMRSRQPLLIDGKQPTDKIQREFMRWVKKELPTYSDRIKGINDRYWRTARGAGLK